MYIPHPKSKAKFRDGKLERSNQKIRQRRIKSVTLGRLTSVLVREAKLLYVCIFQNVFINTPGH